MNIIEKHIEKIMDHYTSGDKYELLKSAKEYYITNTGKIDDETDEYESRMSSFNDWFIFNYRRDDGRRIIDDYINDFNIDDDLAKSFHNTNYSLFSFAKYNFKKQMVLKDILHNDKYVVHKDQKNIGLVPEDLFVGRVISYNKDNYVLRGMCTLPGNVISKLKKESKKIRKLNSQIEEEKFLLKLEQLKTKSLQYSHLDVNQIFVFS